MRTVFLIFLIVSSFVGTIMCAFSFIFDVIASEFLHILLTDFFHLEGEKALIGFTGTAFRNIILIIPLGVWGKKTKHWFVLLFIALFTFYLGYENFTHLFIFSGILIMIGSLFGIIGALKEGLVKRQAMLNHEDLEGS